MLVRTAAGSSPQSRPALRHRVGQPGRPCVVLGEALDHLARAPPVPARPGRRPGACLRPAACAPAGPRRSRPPGPASSDPTGAHRPLDRQHMTVVAGAAQSAAGTPVATSALKSRAPSRWTGTGPGRVGERAQTGHRPGGARRGHVRVLDADERHRRLVVLRRLARPADVAGAQHAVVVVEPDELDPGVHGRRAVLVGDHVLAATRHDGGPRRRAGRGRRSGWPSRPRARTGRPACPPVPRTSPPASGRSGPRRSRRHPTTASAMARRIAGVGWVTVSLRRSTTSGTTRRLTARPLTCGGDHAPSHA